MTENYTIQDAFEDAHDKTKKDGNEWDELYTSWQSTPSPQKLREVVTKLDPTIQHAVSSYAGQQAPPTVRQHAKLLAARAVKSYDPKKGANLRTHVYNQLRALQRESPGISDPFTPAERFRRQQAELANVSEQLIDTLGRDPTDEELAELTGIPRRRVSKVRARMRARLPISTYEESGESDDDSPDIVGEERTDYDNWVDAVYDDLGPLDRIIMMHRSGYRGAEPLDNNAIARKLGMTPSAVSQRARLIQRRLDEFHGGS